MADDNPTPATDDDWDDGWDDEWDVPAVGGDTVDADAADTPHPATPPAAPRYHDDNDGRDEHIVPIPPAETFLTDQPAVRSAGKRRSRSARSRTSPRRTTDTDASESGGSTERHQTHTTETPNKRAGCGLMLIVLIVFGVVCAAALFTFRKPLTALVGGESGGQPAALSTALPAPATNPAVTRSTPQPAPTTSQSARDAVAAAVEQRCVAADGDKTTKVGNGPGDRVSGPGVIFAFDYAYYVSRSGEQAHDLLAPGLKNTTVKTLQDAIDDLPAGTQHCLWITPKDGDKDVYSVKLTEFVPHGGEVVEATHEQIIHTAKDGEDYIIIGIVDP